MCSWVILLSRIRASVLWKNTERDSLSDSRCPFDISLRLFLSVRSIRSSSRLVALLDLPYHSYLQNNRFRCPSHSHLRCLQSRQTNQRVRIPCSRARAEKVNEQIQQMADDLREIKKSKGYPHSGLRCLAGYDPFTVAFLSRFMRRTTLMRTAISQSKLKREEK